MNFEPFMPFEQADPMVAPPVTEAPRTPPTAHFFDRTGCVWMVVCVLFALAATRLLPQLTQPDGWHTTWMALVAGVTATEATATAGAQPSQPPQPTPVKPDAAALAPVVLSQF
jgi:hypothetical protein